VESETKKWRIEYEREKEEWIEIEMKRIGKSSSNKIILEPLGMTLVYSTKTFMH
jgi:hypothetical protein